MTRRPNRLRQIVAAQLMRVKAEIFLALVCVAGYSLTQILTPWPLKFIFDHVLLDKPFPAALSFFAVLLENGKGFALVVLSLSIVVIALAGAVFSYAQLFMTSRVGYEMVHMLRRDLFNHLQRLSLSFHTRARSGELLTQVAGDTNNLREAFTESILTLLVHLLTLIGMFVTMFMLEWKLSLIVCGTLPVMFYALYYVYKNIKASASQQRRKEGRLAARISEILGAMTLVQAFGRERYEGERFESESARTLDESIRTARMEAAATRTVEIISAAGSWAVILFGSFQVLNGQMTPGEILIFAAYVNQVYRPVRNIVKVSTKLSRAMVSAGRIAEIFELEPEIADEPHAIKAGKLKGEIVFRDVCFEYAGGKRVLINTSFKIAAGERVALTGISGAGKSTVVSLMLRLYDPRSGAIFIDGVNIKNYQREFLRGEIGVVLQDSLLFGATIRENIAYGKPEATQQEIQRAAWQAHAHDFIMALPNKYETVLGERGATLSGGQRQRIGLARAIIKRPAILIMDEPTSAVDAESEALIWDAVERLQQERTILLIAHQSATIKRCRRVLVLDDGEITEKSHSSGFARGAASGGA